MKRCSIPGCERNAVSKMMCPNHYSIIRNKLKRRIKIKKRSCHVCKVDITNESLRSKYCSSHKKWAAWYIQKGIDPRKRWQHFEKLRKEKIDKIDRVKNRNRLRMLGPRYMGNLYEDHLMTSQGFVNLVASFIESQGTVMFCEIKNKFQTRNSRVSFAVEKLIKKGYIKRTFLPDSKIAVYTPTNNKEIK